MIQHRRTYRIIFLLAISGLIVDAQWSNNPKINKAISNAAGGQFYSKIISDNAGGAIITWEDRRNGDADIYAQRINASGETKWQIDGLAIAEGPGIQGSPTIVSDGSGGAIITWHDFRNGEANDVYAQRIDSSGVLKWTSSGVEICTAAGHQTNPQIAADKTGGAVIVWGDSRSGTHIDIYTQRIDSSGIVQWAPNGVVVFTSTKYLHPLAYVVSDGAGGGIITWEDNRTSNINIYAQRVDSAGTMRWTANGIVICNASRDQRNTTMVSDGLEGAIIAWEDYRNSSVARDIYAQRINGSGSILWTANGAAICKATNEQDFQDVLSNGAGGAIITWTDIRNGTNDIYAQRINASGDVQWEVNGIVISNAPNHQTKPVIADDLAGGAIIAWADNRSSGDEFLNDIYAQRIDSAGNFHWSSDGLAVSTVSGNKDILSIMANSASGTIITWSDSRTDPEYDIYAQKIITGGGPPTLLTYNKYIHALHWKNPISNPNKLIIAKKVRFTPGATWEVIDEDSTGVLSVTDTTWTIRTSGYCDYKVGAVYNSGDTMYSVPVVVPRGYVLRKIENDSVVAYNIFAHSFRQITNTPNDVWPISYWVKFNYQNPTLYDPIYFSGTDPELLPDLFPNWLLAAEIEGYDKSFVHYPDKVNGGSVAGWRYLARSHNGSCFGFSTASIFDFYREPGFYDKFNFFKTLLPANVPANDSVIHMLSYLQSYQSFGKYNTAIIPTSDDLTVNQVLPELEQYFRNYDSKFYAYLSIGETELCHAIVPYAIEKVNDDLSYIYVYDSNQPAMDDLRIEVQKSTNKWKHSYFTKNKFITGKITLKTGIEKILLPDAMILAEGKLQKVQSQTALNVVMGSSASSYVIQNGDTITGFNATDSTIIHPAMAMILETDGVLRAPAFYNLPSGNYSVLFKDFGEHKAGASMFVSNGKGSSLGVHRNDIPSPDGQDIVLIGDNMLSFINPDGESKELTFQQCIEKPNNGKSNLKYFEAGNITISPSDSIRIAVAAGDNISLVNYGGASTFDLLFMYTDSVSSGTFKNTGVAFPTNSALTIITDWQAQTSTTLTILVDNGNDGTIDDSISIKNEILEVDQRQRSLSLPTDFNLSQNYPNPFNPTTTIGFTVAVTGKTTLMIFNVLGQKVATLYNNVAEAGTYHQVQFNASGLASGIYVARLQSGDKIQMMKMMLVK